MDRLQTLGRSGASLADSRLARRGLLIGGLGLALASCKRTPMMTASRTPPLDLERLNREIAALAERARPGVLGVGLMNLENAEHFALAGERPFPMQSVFKLPLGAAVLAEVDAERLSLAETVTLRDQDLSPPWSPIADAWPGRTAYTLDELLVAAVSNSDNTAADVLMRRIGGPGVVTAWLTGQRFNEIRVDRYERELQPETLGMASFRPAWKGSAAFDAARNTVTPEKRRAAAQAYLADPRDTATPQSMLAFLSRLDEGQLLSTASTSRLLGIMLDSPRGRERILAGLPSGARFAHKIGTGATVEGLSLAYNDVGIFTLKDRRSYAAAAFLTGSTAPEADRAALFAELGRAMVRGVG
ncbi:MAG TPA: class A beta-lactamase [Phenylobacterium sp.]